MLKFDDILYFSVIGLLLLLFIINTIIFLGELK